MSFLGNLFTSAPIDIEVVQATHGAARVHEELKDYHKGLILQYCKLRKSYKKHDATYPEGLGIPGDNEAGFLLAVHKTENGPKVVAGFRLNEVPAYKDVPDKGDLSDDHLGVQADKIEKSRLGNLFPGINRAHHVVLNVDGAMFDETAPNRVLLKAINDLLEAMVKIAKDRGYHAISLIPATSAGLDKRILKYYTGHAEMKERHIAIVDYGMETRKGQEKHVLCVTLDHDLMKLLPVDGQNPAAPKLVAYR